MTDAIILKPCPFCGSKAERKTNRKYRTGYVATVGCVKQLCPAKIEQATLMGTVEDAYRYAEDAWNTRTPEAIHSPAEGRYREREAKTIESIKGALSALGMRDCIDDARDILRTALEAIPSPIGEQKETKLEALEQAIRDYCIVQGGDKATSLIGWLESTTSFVYDKDIGEQKEDGE